MDAEIAAMQMPEEYRDKKMIVMCNDCLKKSRVPFHIVGGKCSSCRSYNTARVDDEREIQKFEQEEEENKE